MLLIAAAVVSFKESNNGDTMFNGRIGLWCGHYLGVDVQDDVCFVIFLVLFCV